MFGLGQKRQEKKAKKELEKLEKKEAKVKEKLAKLEEKQKKKDKKKGIEEKPAVKEYRYDFYVVGIEPHINQIRFELTKYDPDYSFGIDEDEKRYKYTQVADTATLTDDGENITVKVEGYTVGVAPQRQLAEIRKIIAENPDVDVYCDITGGEYIERIGSKIDKGTDPYNVLIILRY